MRVYSAAKTVVDCFKFCNKIGLDIAIEGLKDCLRQKNATINDTYRYAKIYRVSNVIRPYMGSLRPAKNPAASIRARFVALTQSLHSELQ